VEQVQGPGTSTSSSRISVRRRVRRAATSSRPPAAAYAGRLWRAAAGHARRLPAAAAAPAGVWLVLSPTAVVGVVLWAGGGEKDEKGVGGGGRG
jgi:hypothetical protein